MHQIYNDSDIVSIFDSNRPLLPHDAMIRAVNMLDNADRRRCLPLEPCNDGMYYSDRELITGYADRSTLFKGQTPETTRLGIAFEVCNHNRGEAEPLSLTAGMIDAGIKVAFAEDSSRGFKITTIDDYRIFKALIGDNKFNSIKGE